MTAKRQPLLRIMLISPNPLFRDGLLAWYGPQWQGQAEVVGVFSRLEDGLAALEETAPDIVILDYDDRHCRREDLLQRFIQNDRPRMKVVLLSLQQPEHVIIYDRRRLSASKLDAWLDAPWQNFPNGQENC